MRSQKAVKKLKIDDILKKPRPADPPNTFSDIIPSISIPINAKCNLVGMFHTALNFKNSLKDNSQASHFLHL
jgi:hypothetical protein